MSIAIRHLSKRFAATVVCDDLDLTIGGGERVALLGPSGSGKTTLLRLVAGLERPDAGSVFLQGVDVTGSDVRSRGVGLVFQHYALFAHMNVFENIAFGLRVRPRDKRPDEAALRARVDALLMRVQLDGLGGRFPHQLSGGQRQRVALARALAVEPQVLLLDEPFGALDAQVRKELRRWLRRLHEEMPVTTLFVTHDQDEAMEVADRVVVMNRGRIEQDGSPEQVYAQPATPFVRQFLGAVNRLDGGAAADQGHRAAAAQSAAADRRHGAAADHGRCAARTGNGASQDDSAEGVLYVRPDELQIVAVAETGTWPVVVSQVLSLGARTRVECRRIECGQPIEVEMTRREFADLAMHLDLRPGLAVHLKLGRTTHQRPDASAIQERLQTHR